MYLRPHIHSKCPTKTWTALYSRPRTSRQTAQALPPGLPGVGQSHDRPSTGRQHLQPQGRCHVPWRLSLRWYKVVPPPPFIRLFINHEIYISTLNYSEMEITNQLSERTGALPRTEHQKL